MPRGRRRRRPNRRRRNRRRTTWRLAQPIVFPNELVTTSRISYSLVFTGSQSVYGLTYAANGLTDPDVVGSLGLQPQYFQQLMSIYSRYEVLSCQIRISFVNSDNTDLAHLACYPSFDSTGSGAWQDAAQQPYGSAVILSRASGGFPRAILHKSLNIRHFVGRSTASINYTGTLVSNPSNLIYFQVIIAGEQAIPVLGEANVQLTFRSKYFRRTTVFDSVTSQIQEASRDDVKVEHEENRVEFIPIVIKQSKSIGAQHRISDK